MIVKCPKTYLLFFGHSIIIYYPNRTFPPIPAVLPFSVAAKAPIFVQTLLEKTLHQFDAAYFGGEKIEYIGLPDVVYRLDVSIR